MTDPLPAQTASAAELFAAACVFTAGRTRRATDPDAWLAWLSDPTIAARYREKIWIPGSRARTASPPPPARTGTGSRAASPEPGEPGSPPGSPPGSLFGSWLGDDRFCWPWLGAISDTGHGSFRIASAESTGGGGVIPAHLFGYQLANGPLPHRDTHHARDLIVVQHKCDEHGCQNPTHQLGGPQGDNARDYRKRRMYGPLADNRGPAGRTRAIADAIRAGLALGETDEQILDRITTTRLAGEPETLF
ncbi:MAG: hypothetical protein AUG49_19025 [Catenulispora sp. 13_1_20CM_3_70_7]|nr:MAG: hypothetical protein AUG49_19025 [Catenulispora sp. 13_1_20CM_3_70_7]